MTRGKYTCRILKEIRRQIAESNNIELVISECRYKGECHGTCPKCEAEVRYLEQQLKLRQLAGKAITIAGISAGVFAHPAQSMATQSITDANLPLTYQSGSDSPQSDTRRGVFTLKGIVYDNMSDPLIGATIINQTSGVRCITNIDGIFEIPTLKGDKLTIEMIGLLSQDIIVNNTEPITVTLAYDTDLLDSIVTTAGAIPYASPQDKNKTDIPEPNYGSIWLNITDEKGNQINNQKIEIYQIITDKKGNVQKNIISSYLYDDWYKLDWNKDSRLQDTKGKPLKEITLHIKAHGYDKPVTIILKYPKENYTKTIKLKQKNE